MKNHIATPLTITLSILFFLLNSMLGADASGDEQLGLFLQANSAETQRWPKKAIALYEQIIAEKMTHDPRSFLILRCRIRIARIYIDHGQMEKAERTYQEVLKLDKAQLNQEPELLVEMDELADSYSNLSLKQNTKECLTHALQLRKSIDPRHPKVFISYRDLSMNAHNHGEKIEAINYIKSAIAIEKTFPRYKYDQLINDQLILTSLYIRANEIDKSEQQAREILKTSKDFPTLRWSWSRCHYELGRCFAIKYDYDKSDLEFKTALELIKKCPSKRGDVSLLCLQAMQENVALRIKNRAKIRKVTHNCRNALISAGVGKSITAPSIKG